MINLSEIRLGNWVHTPKHPLKECRDSQVTFISEDKLETDKYAGMTSLNNFKPIPLTAEWLVKLGFEKVQKIHNRFHLKSNNDDTPDFVYANGCLSFVVADLYGSVETSLPHIKFVHQLQNLYFCLTGKELELKTVTAEK